MAELISLIVPCYNEEQSLPYFQKEVSAVMDRMNYLDFEIIFVNDGSRDGTLALLRQMAAQDKRIKYLSFSGISARRPPCTPDYSTRAATMPR